MARRKAKTMEVIGETPMEEHYPSVASETIDESPDATGDSADAQHQADLDRAAEAAVEAMEILGKIEDATRNADDAAMQVAKAKGQLKFAKEIYEDHVEHLKELCRTRMEQHPLFDGLPNDQNDAPGEPTSGEGEDNEPVDKDGWKVLPLADLGLPAGIAKSLDNAAIFTIGELCDEMNADPLSWWEDISGIGPAAIQAIADKFIDFWREHPECQEYVEDGEVDEDESDEDEDEASDEDESNEDDE